ncbi:uncharacterized protein MEPE_00254 [Melanopsichium pennsylvanicum]|uniref:Uncharacterized protein n=2 Tax=Melanopsichium pennsylvanicum TaxID=63383 RepID=A0AAJ4XFJ6_9BASI|nr:putative protein [Melanopsichium pennsylvanicum 4]SNX81549.1 uncharacterized protein MEPE_00254 [Melanopsichium pennsylvanicum]
MFSQWRSKRHFPMDSGSLVHANTSSQPTTPVESDFPHNTTRPMQHAPSTRSTGVKALGRVGIGKRAKFRPGTRDGSNGSRSPMSFAAGPRSNSRRGNSLEFGGGVVPDDSHSEADCSESSASPVTPQSMSRDSKLDTTSNGRPANSNSQIRANVTQHNREASHARLESIGTLGSFQDFRSLIAFSSPSNLLNESPALTTSTNFSSPDFLTSATLMNDKPLPAVIADKPQPPIPTSSSQMAASTNGQVSGAVHLTWTPPKRVPVQHGSNSADEPVHLRPQSIGIQRRSTASSFPESVSNPGSSQMASEEFHSPGHRISTTDAMPRLEESVQKGSSSTATFGLGIIAPEDRIATAASSRYNHATTHSGTDNCRHTNSSSDMSGHSSADSRGRASFGRDAMRTLTDTEDHNESHKAPSLDSNKTHKTCVSDSGHSSNTAETSTDIHDPDQLSTIKEHAESPESMLKRRISMESVFSQSQTADHSDVRTSRTSASSARSDAFRSGSLETRINRSQRTLASLSCVDAHGGELMPLAVNGIGSPTFGFRHRNTSQSSAAATELLPPLDIDASGSKTHSRATSNASSSYYHNAPPELFATAELRRGSAGVVSTIPRLATEPSTAPLPSLPFPTSTSAPLLQLNYALSAGQSSEPNTPNLPYQAVLAKAVGKQRKGRPAALALNLTSLSAFSSNSKGGAILSPNNLTFKGLASPGKARVPPPSAPPTDPLPPIPNTPSLVPGTPNPLQRNGSWATAGSSSSEPFSDEADPLKTPKGSRSPDSGKGVKAQDRRGSQASQIRSSGSAPNAAANEHDVSTEKRDAPGNYRVKKTEFVANVDAQGLSTEGTILAVSPAVEVMGSSSLTVVSVDDSFDAATTLEIAKTAIRASAQPMRLSLIKKEATPQKESVPAAMIESASQGVATIVNKSPDTGVNAEQIAQSFPAAPLRNFSYDVESHKQAFQTKPRRQVSVVPRPPPSAWNARQTVSVAHSDFTAPNIAVAESRSGLGFGEPRDGATSVASNHSTFSTLSDRRLEILHDKSVLLGDCDSTRQEILNRTETRFAGAFSEVAIAFRQLQADKLLLEQIVREKTPLTSVGANHADLSNYLSTMNAKLEHSNSEIRKLLDLLEQQREVIEQMFATHQLEKETYAEDVERLHCALDEAQAEADHYQGQLVRLNEEVAKAHQGLVKANAEALRARSSLAEEGRNKDQIVQLLLEAKERLRKVEMDRSVMQHGVDRSLFSQSGEGEGDVEQLALPWKTSAEIEELSHLRKLLEERDQEIAALRLGHADAVMQDTSTTADDASSIADTSASHEERSSADEIASLRAQIQEHKDREKQIKTAYVYVREELRKANSERKRASSVSCLTTQTIANTSPLSHLSPMHRSRLGAIATEAHGHARHALSAGNIEGEEGSGGATPVKLKRLSLPIVARASAIVGANSPSLDPAQQELQIAGGVHPPSAFRGISNGEANVGEQKGKHTRRHSRQMVVLASANRGSRLASSSSASATS